MKCLHTAMILLMAGFIGAEQDAAEDAFKPLPEEPLGKITEFPEWTFCIAYSFRDADERDARPNPFGKSEDPFEGRGESYIPNGSLLVPVYMFDTAGLLARTTSQKNLEKESAQKVFDLTLKENKSGRSYPVYDCYEPHHIIIFYHDFGVPVGCIEVCFACNSAKVCYRKRGIEPALRVYPVDQPDFLSIATLLDGAGLPLTPYKSLEDYKNKLDEKTEKAEQPVGGNGGQAR